MKLSLGALLAICLAGLQFLAVLMVVLFSYVTSERALLQHARTLLSDLGNNTILHSKGFLEPARGTADLAKRLAENNVIASDDPDVLEKLLFQQLQVAPQFSGVYMGDEQGNFVYVMRSEGPAPYRTKIVSQGVEDRTTRLIWRDEAYNIVETRTDDTDTFDPRGRPWYIRAKEARDIIWTDPYIFFSSKHPGITAASPVIGPNSALRGVVGVDIEIDEISDFLSELKVGDKGTAMILNRNGDVIAHPDSDLIKVENSDGTLSFVNIGQIADPIAVTAFGSLTDLESVSISAEVQSEFRHNGDDYVSTLVPVLSDELPWTIAIYAPEDDFVGGIKSNQTRNLWIAALVALGTGLVGLKLAEYIYKPVRDFAKGTDDLLQGTANKQSPLAKTYPELEHANETLMDQIERRRNFEREFGITFDLASRGMAQIDPETGQFIRVNSHLAELMGYTNDQMLNQSLSDLVHPEDADAGLALQDTVHADFEYNKETRFLRKDGQDIWLRLNAILIRDAKGKAMHAVATFDDVTDQKNSEAKISDLRRDLAHFSRVGMIGQMASGLAHELNQPLTAITQNADAALLTLKAQKTSDPELKEILNELDAQAHRGADILRALRGFVSKDGGTKQSFDFAELVDQTFRLVHAESVQHGIELSFMDAALPHVFGNRIQVAQVLVNLLRNAIQSIAESDFQNCQINVSAKIRTDVLEISVEDTGGGVSPEIDLFAQFETSKPDGMGLGLSFSRAVTEANGGKLWFDEKSISNSRFCFTIPITPEEK